MTVEYWWLFATTVFVATFIPGPSVLLVMTNAIRFGVWTSFLTASGVTVIAMLQACAAIAGVGFLLSSSAFLFTLVKWAGAAYLIYLGFTLLRAPALAIDPEQATGFKNRRGLRAFVDGALVAAGNPKNVVFFTALFPQFVDPTHSSTMHYSGMVFALGVIALAAMMIWGALAHRARMIVTRSGVGRWFNKVVGSLFISGGVAVAITDR